MNDRLDEELRALGVGEPTPPGYHGVETRVLQTIGELRQARRATSSLYVVRVTGVAGALGLGMLVGGATAVAVARDVQEVSAFAVQTDLAPSTLLDHHGGGR